MKGRMMKGYKAGDQGNAIMIRTTSSALKRLYSQLKFKLSVLKMPLG